MYLYIISSLPLTAPPQPPSHFPCFSTSISLYSADTKCSIRFHFSMKRAHERLVTRGSEEWTGSACDQPSTESEDEVPETPPLEVEDLIKQTISRIPTQ